MSTATFTTLTVEEAQAELDRILQVIGSIDDARARSYADLLSLDDSERLRRAEELDWLLSKQ